MVSDFYGKGKKPDLKLIRWSDKVDISELSSEIGLLPILDDKYDCGVVICHSRQELFEVGDLLPLLPNEVILNAVRK